MLKSLILAAGLTVGLASVANAGTLYALNTATCAQGLNHLNNIDFTTTGPSFYFKIKDTTFFRATTPSIVAPGFERAQFQVSRPGVVIGNVTFETRQTALTFEIRQSSGAYVFTGQKC